MGSELFTLSLESAQKQVKLSKNDQNQPVKLTINESKLEELEKEMLTDDNEGQLASIDVFCVIDRSGSMYASKIENVKKSLHFLLDLLKPEDRIAITTFDSLSKVILKPKLIGESRKQIEFAIDSIKAGSSTNIAGGLEKTLKCMA